MGGLLLVWGAVALYGEYPTSIADPWSVVLGVTGGTLLIVAILLLLPLPRRRSEEVHPRLTIAAVSVGAASLVAFALLVLAQSHLCCEEGTVPTAGRIVPPALGIVAVGLGVWDLVTSRRAAARIRGSLAGIGMGLCSAIVPIWLWTAHCELFQSGC